MQDHLSFKKRLKRREQEHEHEQEQERSLIWDMRLVGMCLIDTKKTKTVTINLVVIRHLLDFE